MVVTVKAETKTTKVPVVGITVKAAVLSGPGQRVELKEFPTPKLADGEVLIRMIYSEVRNVSTTLRQWHLDFKLGSPALALVG